MPALKGLSSPSEFQVLFLPPGVTTLPFGRVWYAGPNAVANAIGYAEHHSRSDDAVIRVYDAAWQRDRDERAQRQQLA
jgi:hypothetical protein